MAPEDSEAEFQIIPEEVVVESEDFEGISPASAEIVQEGDCYYTTWTLYDDGTIAFSKKPNVDRGEMAFNYGSENDQPWAEYRNDITSVVLNEGVTSIAPYAFAKCVNLTSVTSFGYDVSSIGRCAFQGCKGLEEFTVPGITSVINDHTFDGCTGLKSVNFGNVTVIMSYAFADCTSLENVFLPASTYSIAEGAFWRCSKMETLSMPHTVSEIGKSAFSSCSKLKEVVISDNVTVIEDSTFYNCSSLESVILPYGLTKIGKNAFSSCTALKDCLLPETLTTIGESAFSGCQALPEIVVPPLVTELPRYAFSNCTGAKNIILPEGLVKIGDNAFGFCKVEEILLPVSVQEIGSYAFHYSYELKKIVIPESVKTIGINTFAYCYKLEDVTLPESLESIQSGAFRKCTALKEITIPGNVNSIAANAFDECTALTDIYFHGSRDTWNTFGLTLDGVTIHCDNFSVPINVILSDEVLLYDGTPKTNGVTVSYGDTVLIQDEDYTVSYANNINAGKAIVIIKGIGKYSGETERTFVIEAISLEEANVYGIPSQTWTGKAVEPKVTVYYDEKFLTAGTDFVVVYAQNIEVGVASATVQGKGNFRGAVTKDFLINKAEQNVTIKASSTIVPIDKTATISVDGAMESPKISYASSDPDIVSVNSKGTFRAQDYGSAKITVTVKTTAHYKSYTKTLTIKVAPLATSSFKAENASTGVKLTWKKVPGASGYYIYKGSEKAKTISKAATVSWTDLLAINNGVKYTYKIYAYVKIGTLTIKSPLYKSVTIYHLTKPAAPTLKSSGKLSFTASWKKNAKASGYQVQYSKNSDFSAPSTTKTLSGASALSYSPTIRSGAGKYYVRIRSYKTVNGTKYYSAWSAKKSVTIQ